MGEVGQQAFTGGTLRAILPFLNIDLGGLQIGFSCEQHRQALQPADVTMPLSSVPDTTDQHHGGTITTHLFIGILLQLVDALCRWVCMPNNITRPFVMFSARNYLLVDACS